ncbi:MAG TPA: CoA-acylating methylmalonate-semialdehyde dehydrogenase [Polyangiaceae bacterium]|nr:CoA-acylating methylmalonate-semialdehyde dehydrogenase [Polyangiaceae bacterium]
MSRTVRKDVRDCENFAGGEWRAPRSGLSLDVTNPSTGAVIGRVGISLAEDVADVVSRAREAARPWAETPMKERVRPLRRFHQLVEQGASDLSNLVAMESGKTVAEALAGIERGLEVVEFALGLPNADVGGALDVSRGVSCEYRREPLGVVAGVTPFNFPAMVPLWMFPIALAVGNAFVLKPSEKVPLTACRLAELMAESGLPAGLFSVVHGDRRTVEALVDHPDIRAVGFVGSSAAAKSVYVRATTLGKRALCLGGAKNHLIVAPDADEAITVKGVVDSFTGCAGQRCMAGSVLVVVGDAARFVTPIVEAAKSIGVGTKMGAIIDAAARDRLVRAVAKADSDGATVLLDGRDPRPPPGGERGHFFGPTVLDGVRPEMECAKVELFGPILAVIHVPTLDDALALERASPYGNATAIFTTSGAVASHVVDHATSGMVGINVGVPVPRDPFSFGGTKESKFGHGDITGPGGVELWSNLKKVTTKWAPSKDANWMS